MRIGIDVSQTAYRYTGVSNFIINLLQGLAEIDTKNQYILFFSSLRRPIPYEIKALIDNKKFFLRQYRFPLRFLDIFWNRLHIFPIEFLIGKIDVFVTSDWIDPPVIEAKKVSILYDLIIYKFPKETHETIVATQKRKGEWVKKEADAVICISEATKRDAVNILGIKEHLLKVVYPGL